MRIGRSTTIDLKERQIMTKVVGIRFTRTGKIYYFNPLNLELDFGDNAVVETSRGVEMGEVAQPNHEVEDENIINSFAFSLSIGKSSATTRAPPAFMSRFNIPN